MHHAPMHHLARAHARAHAAPTARPVAGARAGAIAARARIVEHAIPGIACDGCNNRAARQCLPDVVGNDGRRLAVILLDGDSWSACRNRDTEHGVARALDQAIAPGRRSFANHAGNIDYALGSSQRTHSANRLLPRARIDPRRSAERHEDTEQQQQQRLPEHRLGAARPHCCVTSGTKR
jgi:hypothetical protein